MSNAEVIRNTVLQTKTMRHNSSTLHNTFKQGDLQNIITVRPINYLKLHPRRVRLYVCSL